MWIVETLPGVGSLAELAIKMVAFIIITVVIIICFGYCRDISLTQGSANYGLWTKYDQMTVFI